jgi:hypothetical protein
VDGDVSCFMKDISRVNQLAFINQDRTQFNFESRELSLPINQARVHFDTY